jgi:hypothetical protein
MTVCRVGRDKIAAAAIQKGRRLSALQEQVERLMELTRSSIRRAAWYAQQTMRAVCMMVQKAVLLYITGNADGIKPGGRHGFESPGWFGKVWSFF